MKYVLSVEFYDQCEDANLSIGDAISFISFQGKYKGRVKTGIINEIKYNNEKKEFVLEYKVKCGKVILIAGMDYIIKENSKVNNITSYVNEVKTVFPLRT